MATVYRCDRCGREETSALQMGSANVTPPNDHAPKIHDLCVVCIGQLQSWLKIAPARPYQ